MTLSDLQPFSQALRFQQNRTVMPTALDTRGLQQLDAGVRRQSFFSAETMFTDYLDQLKADVESMINPTTGTRADGSAVTQGLDQPTARLRAKQLLQRIGYSPEEGEAGTLKDLSSDARINLVLKTNREMMQGAGAMLQANDPAVREAFPVQELYRLEGRKSQRDWKTRFRLCAQIVGDTDALRVLDETGRMMARLDSPIWQALGDGADGSNDTLGNPYPPFAYGSGMWTKLTPYDEAEALGFVDINTVVESTLPDDLAQLFGVAA